MGFFDINFGNKITPDLLFAAIGFGIAMAGGIIVPPPLSQPVSMFGMFFMFIGSFAAPFVIEWMARNTFCLEIIRDTDGAHFWAFLKKPPSLEIDPATNTSHWRCECRWPVEIPNDTYYGQFEEFSLQSDIPLNERLSSGPREAQLMNLIIDHGHVAPILVQDTEISPSDAYKGKRIPAFKVVRAIQGDWENDIPAPSTQLQEILKSTDIPLKTKFLKLAKLYTKMEFAFNQMRQRLRFSETQRLKDNLAGDQKDSTSQGLLIHQRDTMTEGKIYANHRYRQERDWKKAGSTEQGFNLKKWLPILLPAIVILAVIAYFASNPTLAPMLIQMISQPQIQIFLIIIGIIIVAAIYFIRKNQQ